MQMTACGRAMGGPTRRPSVASSGSAPPAAALSARARPSVARKAPSMSAVSGRRSQVVVPSVTAGISAPASPSRMNRIEGPFARGLSAPPPSLLLFPIGIQERGERMRIALHSVLREGHEAAYDEAHAAIPAELAASFERL